MPGMANSRRLMNSWRDTGYGKNAENGEHRNGQQIAAIELENLCQHTLSGLNRRVNTAFVCTGIIHVRMDECIGMCLLHAMRFAVRARMGMSAHDPTGHKGYSQKQNQLG